MCQKLCKLAGSRQSYCKNKQAYFFWPTLYKVNKDVALDAPGPGHGTTGPSHGSVSVSLPWQLIATPGNRSHRRRRRLLPPSPQVTEHGPGSDQQDHWPSHGWSLHGRESWPGPLQSWPVPDGAGAVQERWRHSVPPAHDALHADHVDHDVQPPSTSDVLDPPASHTSFFMAGND